MEVTEGTLVLVGFTVGAIVLVACAVNVAVDGIGVDVFMGVLISVLVACAVAVKVAAMGVEVFVGVLTGVLVESTLPAPP